MHNTLTESRRPSGFPARPSPSELNRLDRARGVLEQAREVIERGWLQHGWYTTSRPAPRSLIAQLRQPSPGVDDLGRACLVAAVAVAAHGGRGRPDVLGDAGPVLDVVWDALRETAGAAGRPASGRAAAAAERVARMRELVRWNDARDRTKQDVLGLLDRAISRTILSAVGAPA